MTRWGGRLLSLRAKITAAFTLVVVGGTVVSTVIGARIVENALVEQAHAWTAHALTVAGTVYDEAVTSTSAAVVRAAASPALDAAGQLDFVRAVTAREAGADPCLSEASMQTLVRAAEHGIAQSSTELLTSECLGSLGPFPARRAAGSALALIGVAPGRTASGASAVVYGGILLGGRRDLVQRMEKLAYGRTDDDRQIGVASIVARGEPIATSELMASGSPALGVTASPDRYIAASAPLRNAAGIEVGAVRVAMLREPILAQRTKIMLTFLVVCAFGLVVVFAFIYLITRRMIHPLEEMVTATRTIAGGDLSVRVSVSSRDEIGQLAASFNEMLAGLQETRRQLEEWGRTLEERVRQRTGELAAAQQRVARAEKLASIGRLAAGVAHSINNPLGGILSLSLLALEEVPAPSRLQEDLDTIAQQALRARDIVKGLLEFSRESETHVVQADATSIVDGALSLLERQRVFGGVALVRRFHDGPTPVLIDPGRLQEAVTNLVMNAIDAMESSGVLTVETSVACRPDEVLIQVSDTGGGIPPKVMPLLFEPFFTTKKVGKGTGLGLAIVHGIVTAAGGRVDVTSIPGNTTFTVRLPLASDGDTYELRADRRDRQPVAGS
jgi:two-component system NtrC family sensor kinase